MNDYCEKYNPRATDCDDCPLLCIDCYECDKMRTELGTKTFMVFDNKKF